MVNLNRSKRYAFYFFHINYVQFTGIEDNELKKAHPSDIVATYMEMGKQDLAHPDSLFDLGFYC